MSYIFHCITIMHKSRQKLNNFVTVNNIDFLFSILHTAPHPYLKIYFSVLHKHSADVTRSDTREVLTPPHLQVGAFKSLQMWCIRRGVLSLLILSCFVNFYFISVTEIQLCKFNAHFPARFAQSIYNKFL